jgi:hypothetical protein
MREYVNLETPVAGISWITIPVTEVLGFDDQCFITLERFVKVVESPDLHSYARATPDRIAERVGH